MDYLKTIDTALFLFFNGAHSAFGDFIFYWISDIFIWVPLYLFIIGLIIKQWKKKAISILLFLVMAVTCNDQTCNLLKKNIGRIRPSHTVELSEKVHLVKKPDGSEYRGGRFSFPSAHAANSIVLVWFFGFFVKTRKRWPLILMIIWSLSLAYSRLYLGVHYPLDLIAGFAVGSCWGFLFISIWKKIFASPVVKCEKN